MTDPTARDAITDLLKRHADLEATSPEPLSGEFISGWQSENPWRETREEQVRIERAAINASR
jgi:hypothetical protein